MAFCGFWLVVMALWFLGCALWLSVLAFFDFQMLCYLTYDPFGVITQKGKWLICNELRGYNVALVGAW